MTENLFDSDSLIERILSLSPESHMQNVLSVLEIEQTLERAKDLFLSEPTLLRLSTPQLIIGEFISSNLNLLLEGDVKGHLKDLLHIFSHYGLPSNCNTPFLFLGNLVDNGKSSLEVVLLLLLLKLKYPSQVHILRGNHECASINRIYGFYDQGNYTSFELI